MADNYLEKKMEELRARRVRPGCSQTTRKIEGRQKGMLSLKFPSRRVLIAVGDGLNAEKALEIANLYRRHDCKTAIIGEGIRSRIAENVTGGVHRLLETIDINEEVKKLYKAWLGLDILIAAEGELKERIEEIWEEERTKLPGATFYTPRTLTINGMQVKTKLHEEETPQDLERQLLIASL